MDNLNIIRQKIRERREALGYSYQNLADLTHLSKSTLQRYETGNIGNLPLDKLENLATALECSPAYLMGWENSEAQIPPGFMELPPTVKKPLVGRIACGTPILAEQNIDDYIDVPAKRQVDFCLLCVGDSMIDAGIQDGDVVYIRAQPCVENGEIAAVRIGEEATLKRVYIDKDTITLVAANANFPPKSYSKDDLSEVRIEGKVVGYTHWI